MYEEIQGFDERTVAVRASGTVSGDDYARVLTPAVDRATAGGRRARLYMELGEDFQGFDASGMAADAVLGLGHLGSFERSAVVTDVSWIRNALAIFGRLIPGEVRLFGMGDADTARDWIRG